MNYKHSSEHFFVVRRMVRCGNTAAVVGIPASSVPYLTSLGQRGLPKTTLLSIVGSLGWCCSAQTRYH